MKRKSILCVLFFSLLFASNSFASLQISILWEDTVDSSLQDLVILDTAGVYHFDLIVSGITEEAISEIQFDLVNPLGTDLNTSVEPTLGDATSGWLNLSSFPTNEGNSDPGFRVILNQFTSSTSLENGVLFSGFEIELAESLFDSSFSLEFTFDNIKGANADDITLNPLTLNSVPIPSSLLLLGGGICVLLGANRRKQTL
ncbi:hypothetical protein [uncultured Desulfobacter sp.]|uniref:hypothetical protein n=1 Tax=uncultured Desulfobacter sp. TaxID=240139 RepID=UPI0029F4EF74|nr:hypothetical protein [uncultured Desulfobacter sp.]